MGGAVLLAAGCAGPVPEARVTPIQPSAPCVIASDHTADTVAVGVTEPIQWMTAPVPRNESERFVFAQLYATLVNVDCEGRVYAGLAQTWRRDTVHAGWVFTLAADARFWDGRPVEAADVVVSLAGQDLFATALGPRAVSVPDRDTVPRSLTEFAGPWLAIATRLRDAPWPIGTGAYQPAGQMTGGDTVVLTPVARSIERSLPTIALWPTGTDARDLIDAGADIVVTDDRSVIDYGSAVAGVEAMPLPWTWVYALLSPTGAPELAEAVARDSADLRQAVRVEAHAAEQPFWWVESGCPRVPATPASPTDERVLYLGDDQVAGDLASRLVVLPGSGVRTATPVSPEAWATAIRAGSAHAFVVRLPHRVFDACRAVRHLREGAPWVHRPEQLLPLLMVRSTALIRTRAGRVTVDWDGTLRLGGSSGPFGRVGR